MHHPPAVTSPNKTGFDMYGLQTDGMMNIELARILQEDREREIAADIRARRLVEPTGSTATRRDPCAEVRPLQRRPSTGATAR
jgi:hypothetical protein